MLVVTSSEFLHELEEKKKLKNKKEMQKQKLQKEEKKTEKARFFVHLGHD